MRLSLSLAPLYLAILLVGIAGREVAAKPPARFPSADDAAVVRFHRHYNLYFRHLFGCPLTATDAADCRPLTGYQDTEEWRQARDLAKAVFSLKD